MAYAFRPRTCGVVAVLSLVAGCDSGTKPEPPAAAAALAFDAEPRNAVAGSAISPAVRVRVLDASGNLFTGAATVTLTLGNANGASLLGTLSAQTANGVATFGDLRLEKAGVGYVVTASSGSLTGASSNPFDVTHAAPARLRFIDQPQETTAGTPMTRPITVEITDAFDNRATTATNAIALAPAGTTPSAAIVGTLSVGAVGGVGTFGSVSMTRPGTYALSATATGLTTATSESFVVRAAETARYCPGGYGAGGATFDTFADALASVTTGGTILICDGTHELGGTGITRAVTIRPEHEGKVTITNRLGSVGFLVSGVDAGTVRISGLTFDVSSDAGVRVDGVYDQVIVEGSTFRAALQGTMSAVDVKPSTGPSTEALVTLRGNTASGFFHTFVANNRARMDVIDNTIDASTQTGILFGADTRGVIQRNRVTACGIVSCIQASPWAAGPVEILDNEITSDVSRRTSYGISASGRVTVRGNRVIGTGGTGLPNPTAADAFAMYNGISVAGATGATPVVEGNEVRNAVNGLALATTPAGSIVRNNRISKVYLAFAGDARAADRFERNDLTEFAGAVALQDFNAGASFKCNWWGRAIGPFPTVINAPPPKAGWQPHSTVPIAGRPEVSCDPAGAPLPTRFCPQDAAAGTGWGSFADAYAVTLPGATIAVCDGTFPLKAEITTPVTIAAENPLGATLTQASPIEAILTFRNGGPEKAVVRDLRFQADDRAIWILSQGDVTIERNHFAMADGAFAAILAQGLLSRTLVKDNVFVGGERGVWADAGGSLEILANTFSGQRDALDNATIDLERGLATYVVRGNRLTGCPSWCIRGQGGDVQVIDNDMQARVADATRSAVNLLGGNFVVTGNKIGSPDPAPADRSVAGDFAFTEEAILVDAGSLATANATVSGNSVRHANIGIHAFMLSGVVAGQDNVVALTNVALRIRNGAGTFHRNDFTDYVTALSSVSQAAGALSCNYWEGGSAPAVDPAHVPAVQPHSPVPIAKTTVSCP